MFAFLNKGGAAVAALPTPRVMIPLFHHRTNGIDEKPDRKV